MGHRQTDILDYAVCSVRACWQLDVGFISRTTQWYARLELLHNDDIMNVGYSTIKIQILLKQAYVDRNFVGLHSGVNLCLDTALPAPLY